MNAIVTNLDALRADSRARFEAGGMCGKASPPAKGQQPNPAGPAPIFEGAFDQRESEARDGAQSSYDGVIAASWLDGAVVRAILPPKLELAKPIDPSLTQHPVIYLLGRQNDPRELRNGQNNPIPKVEPYDELILLIPYTVRMGGNRRWHSFAARMYLDNTEAIVIGNVAYAYGKEPGSFESSGNTAYVLTGGNTCFESEVDTGGPWLSEAQASTLPGFARMREILDMPIVGFSSVYGYVPSYFEWDCSSAEIAVASSLYRFVRAFRPGMQPWVDLGYLESAPDAAFRLRKVRWRLSTVFPRHRF